MKRLHSSLLTIVMSIFLIQAIDPPYERNTGSLIHVELRKIGLPNEKIELKNERFADEKTTSVEKGLKTVEENTESLIKLQEYLNKIKKDRPSIKESKEEVEIIERFLKRKGKTEYEKLLEKDFVRPLLKLYENQELLNSNDTLKEVEVVKRISKEDNVEDLRSLTKEELDLLLHSDHYYQDPEGYQEHDEVQFNTFGKDHQPIRRDDLYRPEDDKEHIGEILPPNFNTKNRFLDIVTQPSRYPYNARNFRKSYDEQVYRSPSYSEGDLYRYRKPIRLQGERFRPEYEPSDFDDEIPIRQHYRNLADQFEVSASFDESRSKYVRSRYPFSSDVQGYRIPRKQRGYRELYYDREPVAPVADIRPGGEYRPVIDIRPGSDLRPSSDVRQTGDFRTGSDFRPGSDLRQGSDPRPVGDPRPGVDSRPISDFRPGSEFRPGKDLRSSKWQSSSWSASRRPRVIFPSDLVAFREPNEEEPDYLGSEASLQDLQQSDNKDRGEFFLCSF